MSNRGTATLMSLSSGFFVAMWLKDFFAGVSIAVILITLAVIKTVE